MSFVLTLVASPATPDLGPAHLAAVQGLLDQMGIRFAPDHVRWLSPHHAADMTVEDCPDFIQMGRLRDFLEKSQVDILLSRAQMRRPQLFMADMDATILQGETLDELAAHAGIGAQVADITARAMRGEIDFRDALALRLDLIAGLPASALDQVWRGQKFSAGAATLVQTLRAHGCTCVLVSGGFTYFTVRVAEKLGFHHHHGNLLDIQHGALTGMLIEPVLGKAAKLDLLTQYRQKAGAANHLAAAIGDGSNDLPMLENADMGFGYRPKPILRERLVNQILYGDLTAALYAMGFDDTSMTFMADPQP